MVSQRLSPAERPEAAGPAADSAAGGPPAHWLEKVRSAGPPADWLERVQRAKATQGELSTTPTPRVEPASAHPVAPAGPGQAEPARGRPTKHIPLVGPLPRLRERRAPHTGPAAPPQQPSDDRVEPAQEPRRQAKSTKAAIREVRAGPGASAAASSLEQPPGEKPRQSSPVPEQKSAAVKGAAKELPPPRNSARPAPARQMDWGKTSPAPAADKKKDIRSAIVAHAAPPEIEERRREQLTTRDARPAQGVEPAEGAPGARQWATMLATQASPEIEVAWVKSPQPEQAWPGRAQAQNEPAPKIENQWPALLDDMPDAIDEWEIALRAWEHLKRLDQEQQG